MYNAFERLFYLQGLLYSAPIWRLVANIRCCKCKRKKK